MRVLRSLVIGLVCWPMEALCAMWGLDILRHEQFNVPTPGYLSCFLVVVGGELLLASVTLTRRAVEATE